MKTAAVILEDEKLPIYEFCLKKGGFKYQKHAGPIDGVRTLPVEIKNANQLRILHALLQNAESDYRHSKLTTNQESQNEHPKHK